MMPPGGLLWQPITKLWRAPTSANHRQPLRVLGSTGSRCTPGLAKPARSPSKAPGGHPTRPRRSDIDPAAAPAIAAVVASSDAVHNIKMQRLFTTDEMMAIRAKRVELQAAYAAPGQ